MAAAGADVWGRSSAALPYDFRFRFRFNTQFQAPCQRRILAPRSIKRLLFSWPLKLHFPPKPTPNPEHKKRTRKFKRKLELSSTSSS